MCMISFCSCFHSKLLQDFSKVGPDASVQTERSTVICTKTGQTFFLPRSEVPLLAAILPQLLHHSVSHFFQHVTRALTTCAKGRSTGLLDLEATLVAQAQAPLFTSMGLRPPKSLTHGTHVDTEYVVTIIIFPFFLTLLDR